jgi:hypothetical protein
MLDRPKSPPRKFCRDMAILPKDKCNDRQSRQPMLLSAALPPLRTRSARLPPVSMSIRIKPQHGKSRAQSVLFRTWLRLHLHHRMISISAPRIAPTHETERAAPAVPGAIQVHPSDGIATSQSPAKWVFRDKEPLIKRKQPHAYHGVGVLSLLRWALGERTEPVCFGSEQEMAAANERPPTAMNLTTSDPFSLCSYLSRA